MVTLIWVAVALVLAALAVHTAFLAMCGAKLILAKVPMPWFMRLVIYLWLIVGYPADVIFNWTVGTLMFRELRGFTFSSHIQDRVDRGLWDMRTVTWVRVLNAGDPNHIKRVPEE